MDEMKIKNDLLLDLIKNQKSNSKTLKHILIVVIVSYTVIICTLIGGIIWYESQYEYETVVTEHVTTTNTTTTDQSIEGDNAAINNIEGDYNN